MESAKDAAPGPPELSQHMRQHVHETLEKIAWEVVPKLAETLIQEEIRKLKNDE